MKKKPTTTWTFDVSSAESKAKIAAWNARVIRDICLRTKPITPDERTQIIAALHGMYEAANIPHDDLRIVFVPSPFMAHVVAGHAEHWWKSRTKKAATSAVTRAATYDATAVTRAATEAATRTATRDATEAATEAVTEAATRTATRDATEAATYDATRDDTRDATRDATDAYAATDEATDEATYEATYDATAVTRAATYDATDEATYEATRTATRTATEAATYDATRDADDLVGIIKAMIAGASRVSTQSTDALQLRDSGADWYHWHSYLAFVRDVVGWSHPSHANFAHAETVQRLGGPRYMHSKFVVVSDHPIVRNVVWINGVATLHCDTGPAVAWADGSAIYAIDGVILPHDGIGRKIVESPASLTISEIDAIDNADARSIAIRRFGWHRYVREIHADCIDYRRNDIEGTREALFRTPKDGNILVAVCPTGRVFGMRVPPTVKDCAEAQSYLAGTRSGRVVART